MFTVYRSALSYKRYFLHAASARAGTPTYSKSLAFPTPFHVLLFLWSREGTDLASVGRLAFCSLRRFCRMRGQAPRFLANARRCPPRLRRCPPSLVGFLARNLASRFASGALLKLIADLEAPWRKTPTFKKPRDRPTPGGSAEGAGGLFSQSAKPATRSPPNLGGSAERSEARGACPRILQNRQEEQNANHTPDARSAPSRTQ